jgi:hypothetical protein
LVDLVGIEPTTSSMPSYLRAKCGQNYNQVAEGLIRVGSAQTPQSVPRNCAASRYTNASEHCINKLRQPIVATGRCDGDTVSLIHLRIDDSAVDSPFILQTEKDESAGSAGPPSRNDSPQRCRYGYLTVSSIRTCSVICTEAALASELTKSKQLSSPRGFP